MLGGKGCKGPSCGALVRTDDGGHHWRRLTVPAASIVAKGFDLATCEDTVSSPCINQVIFSDARVGYAYGTSLFMTTDGGATWRKQSVKTPVGSEVVDMALSGGTAFRTVTNPSCIDGAEGCTNEIDAAPLGSTTWRTVYPSQPDRASVLRVQGTHLYVGSFVDPVMGPPNENATFARSTDNGMTWTPFSDPCRRDSNGAGDAWGLDASAPSNVVVWCSSLTSPNKTDLMISTNNGDTFGARIPVSLGTSFDFPRVYMLATGAFLVMYQERDRQSVGISKDGAHYTRTLTVLIADPYSSTVESVDLGGALNVHISLSTAYLWASHDEGRTWLRLSPFAGL